jgi:hypothetical protein
MSLQYCVVQMNGVYCKTEVVRSSLNPQWNETFTFVTDKCVPVKIGKLILSQLSSKILCRGVRLGQSWEA